MLQGKVNVHAEPTVSIRLILSQRRPLAFSAIIDTGFNGYISIPRKVARRGGWRFLGKEDFETATGESVEQAVYLGQVIFDREHIMVYAVATESEDVLIGTRLLEKKILTINFRKKSVKIE